MLINGKQLIAIPVGYFIFALFLIELISLALLHFFRLNSASTKELRRNSLLNPFFKKSDSYSIHDTWRQQYHKEIEEIFNNPSNQASNKWQPLGLWSAPRYHGKYVNIDKYNLRRTVDPRKNYFVNNRESLRICFFGGSHVWGWEVRDESTIPSKLLSLRNNAIVENHGQLGYVSSQSVIAFIQRIKYGPKPDIVVFIDGFNDIYSAYQSGMAGIEQNAISRKQRFDGKNSENIFDLYIKNSKFLSLIRAISPYKKSNNRQNFSDDNKSLAQSIMTAYNQNVLLIEKITSAYNIKAFYIWAPTIFDKPNLTKYERSLLPMIEFCEPLYKAVKRIIQDSSIHLPHFINLSNIFHQNKEPIFIDPWHYNEHANYLIAKKINESITLALNNKTKFIPDAANI
jgi:hypothetical protein